MPNSDSQQEDLASKDEIKVFKNEEQDEDSPDEKNLSEDKIGLLNETQVVQSTNNSRYNISHLINSSFDNKLPEEKTILPSYQMNGKCLDMPGEKRRTSSLPHKLLPKYPHHLLPLPSSSMMGIMPDLMQFGQASSRNPLNSFPAMSMGSRLKPPPAHMGGMPQNYPQMNGPLGYPNLEILRQAWGNQNMPRFPQFNMPANPALMDLINANLKEMNNIGGPSNNEFAPRKMSKKDARYVKKPLNAFMLFMKENRAAVVEEHTLKESAAINQILGRKWHALSSSDQQVYYDMAKKAKKEHIEKHPNWSARDNYATHSKRKRVGGFGVQDEECFKKCRARFGINKLFEWCQPCRRKKKCIRYEEYIRSKKNGFEGMEQFQPGFDMGNLHFPGPPNPFAFQGMMNQGYAPFIPPTNQNQNFNNSILNQNFLSMFNQRNFPNINTAHSEHEKRDNLTLSERQSKPSVKQTEKLKPPQANIGIQEKKKSGNASCSNHDSHDELSSASTVDQEKEAYQNLNKTLVEDKIKSPSKILVNSKK